MTDKLFPMELLDQPPDLRKKYFEELPVAHPIIQQKLDEVMNLIIEPIKDRPLIFIIGPAGVGKTYLMVKVEEKYYELGKPESGLPIVTVEVKPVEQSASIYKALFMQMLAIMNEPIPSRRVSRVPGATSRTDNDMPLREHLEAAIKYKKTRVIQIDEAHHLINVASGLKLIKHLDIIKSLANTIKIPVILFGTYELLSFINIESQSSRRSNIIHFPRYRYEIRKEMTAFKNVLNTFQLQLPLREDIDLVGNWEEMYERSIGCVGILKTWLQSALKARLADENSKKSFMYYLRQTAYSPGQCKHMIQEALWGENAEALSQDTTELKSLIKYGQKSKQEETKHLTNKQVGSRKPTKDPVG
jgi:thymidine kinase